MVTEAESLSVQQFIALVQVFAGRLGRATVARALCLLSTIICAVPRGLHPPAYRIVRDITTETILRVRSRLGSVRYRDDLPRHLPRFWQATSPEELTIAAEGYASALRASTTTVSAPRDPRVERALAYIGANCGRSSLTVTDVASHVRLSRWHLARLLRLDTGRSFTTHLREFRISRAVDLLTETFLTIKEIADVVGYTYVTEFDRQFRQTFGVTPSQWRAKRVPRHLSPNHVSNEL